MVNNEKEVRFDLFCKTCKHYQDDESEEVCDDCLNHPVNINSKKPTRWVKK